VAQQTYSGIPAAFATGDVLTAANLNLIRDWIVASIKEGQTGDTGEILPAIYDLTNNRIVLDAGGLEFSDATTQTTAATGIVSGFATTAAQETTTSTSFTDLATVGPTVTLTTGTKALVLLSADIDPSTSSGFTLTMGCDVSGASTVGASDAQAMYHFPRNAATGHRGTAAVYYSGLTAGSNVFKAKYKTSSGTAYFFRRELTVLDLGS